MGKKTLKFRRYRPEDNEVSKELNYAGLKQMRPDVDWKGVEVADGDYDDIEDIYIRNRGEFLVGTLDGEVVVTGAVKKLRQDTAEIKRIRVKPELQRRGYGEAMLRELIRAAERLGYKRIRIDTMVSNTRARQLFKKTGFRISYYGKIGGYKVLFHYMDLKGN
jgi:ribosomal protein S18 acetylase RimI-like enzyme